MPSAMLAVIPGSFSSSLGTNVHHCFFFALKGTTAFSQSEKVTFSTFNLHRTLHCLTPMPHTVAGHVEGVWRFGTAFGLCKVCPKIIPYFYRSSTRNYKFVILYTVDTLHRCLSFCKPCFTKFVFSGNRLHDCASFMIFFRGFY